MRVRAVATLAMLATLAAVAAPAAAMQGGGAAAAAADSTTPVTVTGTVYDSVAHTPLAGALVQLVEATHQMRVYSATTDSAGAFTIPSVPPGRYAAGFFHPSVDALGIEPPLVGVILTSGQPAFVALAIPSATRISAALCGAHGPADSTGALVGIVRDADTGTPLGGARVVVTWREIVIGTGGIRQEQRRVPAQTRPDGGYVMCGLPDDQVIASADSGSRQSGLIQVEIPTHGLVRRDLAVAGPAAAVATHVDSTPGAPPATVLRGTARLTGTVRGPNGRPMSDARVTLWGSGLSATTDAAGHFTLTGLPAGTFSAQARAIGYAPATTSVDLASNQTASVNIALTEQATALAPVTVYGHASAATRFMNDFMQRKREGFGHFLTAADLQNRFAVTDALRMVPGLHVSPSGWGETITGRGGCTPAIYLDGMQLNSVTASPMGSSGGDNSVNIDDFIQPTQVMGIEVYNDLGAIPPQYSSNGCGVILIWSKR